MKWLILIVFACLLTACANSSYRYQAQTDVNTWKGRNIKDLQQQWGSADDVLHNADGSSVYVYLSTSGGRFYNATSTNFTEVGPNDTTFGSPLRYQRSGNLGLKCTSLFSTNSAGVIVDVSHQGNNCGGEWVPRSQ